MGDSSVMDQQFQEGLQELLAAAKAMTEGDFHRTVTIKTRGMIGELASYINHTLKNLQQLDPMVDESRRDIPRVAADLHEIIASTEQATNRVLEQAEGLLDAHAQIDRELQRVRAEGDPNGLAAVCTLEQSCQARAMDIMAAMEFQDLTSQKIQKLIGLITEVEARLLQLLAIFRVQDAAVAGRPADAVLESCAQDPTAFCNQDLVDALLNQFQAGQS